MSKESEENLPIDLMPASPIETNSIEGAVKLGRHYARLFQTALDQNESPVTPKVECGYEIAVGTVNSIIVRVVAKVPSNQKP